jgi:formylglycine-generating enzyme required for sulfatase activity
MIIVLLLTLLLTNGGAETYALIMGAGNYRDDVIKDLPMAIKDAARVYEVLLENGLVKVENITYISNPGYLDFKFEIEDLIKKGEADDRLIFYYAGHSEVGENEDGKTDTYLCGIDVRKDYLQRSGYNFREEWRDLSSQLKAAETIMIFDTCYAGGLTKERKLLDLKIESKNFEDIAESKGVNFLFSSGAEETSLEKKDDGGWFTYYLLEGLNGDANLDRDDYVSLEELSTYVQQKVAQSTQDKQNPMSIIVKGDIQLIKDEKKSAIETSQKISDLYFEEKITLEQFKLYGGILRQEASEDTMEEAEIRTILLNYNQLPSLGAAYLEMMTAKYLTNPVKKTYRIESVPENATLYINGSYMGTSPMTQTFEEGAYSIEAKKEGYKTAERTIEITDKTTTKNLTRTETITLTLEKETGESYIQSSPSGASIYLNGNYKGTTPKTLTGLEAGTYSLKVTKSGYEDKTETIGVEAGERTTKNYNLTKEITEGSLYIKSSPSGASVYLDGTYKGTTPKQIENISAGSYTLKVTKSGYEDESMTINVRAGETAEKTVYLTEEMGELYISSSPSGANIYIDGSYKGTTPKTINGLNAGYYDIKLKKDGYEEKTEYNVRVTAGKQTTKQMTLNKIQTESEPELTEMVFVEGGTFKMGDEFGDLWDSCRPVHSVTLSYDYWLGKYEVTFDEYDRYCEETGTSNANDRRVEWDAKEEKWIWGKNMGRGKRPVINVNWSKAIKYCNWLSEKEGLKVAYDDEGNLLNKNGNRTDDITKVEGYRLPTEAEWEYAARGGKENKGYQYSGSNNLDEVGWYEQNCGTKGYSGSWKNEYVETLDMQTHEVGTKKPNELGIYDMSGNVWEWCQDWYDDSYYGESPSNDPVNLNNASRRVSRGGSWGSGASRCRVAYRDFYGPSSSFSYLGFRVARTRFF